jgi:drug/metabolite transporter (DMT)-like permease
VPSTSDPAPTRPDSAEAARLQVIGTTAVSAATVLFAVNNVLVGSMSISGVSTALYRLWLGTIGFLLLLRLTGRRPSVEVIRAAVPAGIAYGLHISVMFVAFQTTSMANVTVILAMQTGLTLTLVGRLFGEEVHVADMVLAAVATAGAVLVIVGGGTGGAGDLRGDGLAVLGMLGVMAYFILAKQARVDAPAGEFQFGLLLVAAVIVLPVAALTGDITSDPDGGDWVRLGWLTVGGTAAHLGLNWAHRHVPLKTTSLLVLAVPVISTGLAWVVLDQHLSAVQFLGAGVALVALAAVTVRAVNPPAEVASAEPVEPDEPGGGLPSRAG